MGKNKIVYKLLPAILILFLPWISLIAQDSKASFYEKFKSININVNFRSTDIDDVIKIFSEKMKINIIRNDNIEAKITANLQNINVLDALEVICRAHSINYLIEDAIMNNPVIRIYTQKDYLKALIYKGKADIIKLKYAKASEVFKKLQESGAIEGNQEKSYSGGIFYADEASNSIIIVDKSTSIKRSKLREIIEAFDQPASQVLIEAKILSVSLNDETSFGIKWNLLWKADFVMPFSGDTASDASLAKTYQFKDGSGSISGLITALSEQGDVKVLSNPRIVVLNNEEAKIIVGKNEPYSVTTTIPSGGSTLVTSDTKFVEVGIGLTVKPQINQNNIILKIKPNVSSAAERKSESLAPTVTKSEAETIVSIKNGTTLILGGLIETKQMETVKRVPILGHIPLLGYLFSSRSYVTQRSELVIFLTPTIIKDTIDQSKDLNKLKDIEKELEDD
ncbi:MAG: hypothetical protein KKH98_11085 [Spirochaetes bacterium]|nr:hypothetical protein [Spirochaetota bacterium]